MPISDLKPLTLYVGGNPDAFRNQSLRDMLWRPTVVIFVRCGDRYLVTTHKVRRQNRDMTFRWKMKPDLPKGGVDAEDNSVMDAAYRELLEEVCLLPERVNDLTYFAHVLVEFDEHNFGRDGYKKGKWYLMYHAHIEKQQYVAPGFDHGIESVHWLADPAAHFKRKDGKRTKKYRILTDPVIQGVFSNRLAA